MTIIDWGSLNAPEFPRWLVGLMSRSEDQQYQSKLMLLRYLQQHALALNIADSAYSQVLETDAAILITEILVEILVERSHTKPAYVVEILEVVSSYKKTTNLSQIQRQRALRIYNLVINQFDLYLDMLTHPDADVRISIINLLGNMPEKRRSIASSLIHHLKTKHITGEIEVVSALKIIFEATKSDEYDTKQLKLDFIAILNEHINHKNSSKVVLAHTACLLTLLQGSQVENSVLMILQNILTEANLSDPSEDLGLSNLWVDAFLALGIHQATRYLLHIFDNQDDMYMIVYTSAILLNLHFGNHDMQSLNIHVNVEVDGESYAQVSLDRDGVNSLQSQEFSDIQKEILRSFLKKNRLWEVKTNLFMLFALPTSRFGLQQLLEQS